MDKHPMRRALKKITDPSVIDQLLKKATVCHLGLSDNGQPYVVPMNYGYADIGSAVILEDPLEKEAALNKLMRGYTGTDANVFSPQALRQVCVIRVDIEDIRAKGSAD